jgi:hypothetical protein
LASVSYFSPLAAPTVTGFPSATFPHFDVQVFVPTTGRVLFGNLFYTVSASPSASDWKLLANASTSNSQPVTNNTYYTFADLSLGAGTYYFAYLVGNETSQSILSPISASFVWSPVGGSTGPTGATGPTGTGTTGATGLAAITAYKQQSQSLSAPTFTTPTSGSAAPSGWSLSAPSVTVGQVLWYIQGKYNSSTITIDGVAPNTTAWTGPVAASIFQDIRSDNWDGGTPTTNAPTGTAGYYIKQSNGNMYLNSVYGRGQAIFNGTNTVGSYTFSLVTNSALGSNGGLISYSASIFNGAVMGYGSGGAWGGYFDTSGSQAALACNTSGSGSALQVNGPMTMFNSTQVTNLNANYLQGNLASAFATTALGTNAYAANRLNGSAGANVLRFVQGTVTGSSTATFNPTNKPASASTNVWIEITIDATTLYIPVWT